jgi:hypothetical protein
VDDRTPAGDHVAVQEALYRAVAREHGLELLLNSVVDFDGDRATVSSVSVVLGGDVRDPKIVSCGRVLDSLQCDDHGRWRVGARASDDNPRRTDRSDEGPA